VKVFKGEKNLSSIQPKRKRKKKKKRFEATKTLQS